MSFTNYIDRELNTLRIFLAIVAIVIIYSGGRWFISYMNAYDEISISEKSKSVLEKEALKYNQKVLLEYGDMTFGDVDERIFSIDTYKVKFKSQGYGTAKQKNYNIVRDSNVTLKIYKEEKIIFETKFNLFEAPYLSSMEMYISFDIVDNKLYLLYKTQKKQEALHLLVANLDTNQTIFHEKILEQKYGFFRLAIAYHKQINSILLAYQDISANSLSEGLMYGVYNLTNHSFIQEPHSLFLYDKWEKSHPRFMRDAEQLYLLNTTGENWGLLSYSGFPAKGLSKINSNGKPINYFIMYDDAEMIEAILEENTLMYRLRHNNEKNIVQTKSIDISLL